MEQDAGLFDDVLGRCVAAPTLRAARVVTRRYDHALAGHGITITQFTLLIAIGRYRPRSLTGLAEGLDLERSTLSRNIAKLKDMGLVVASGDDGHAQELGLTAEGVVMVKATYPKWRKVQDAIEAELGEPALGRITAALRELQQARA